MTPVEYIERRLEDLRSERPRTRAGREALAIAIRELEAIALRFKIETLAALDVAIREAEGVH